MSSDNQTLLSSFRMQRLLDEMDYHFALLMGRLSGDSSTELVLAAALTSNRTARGDTCLELLEWGGRTLGKSSEGETFSLPDSAAWEESLSATPVVCRPGGYAPLVLDYHGRLYLYRYWEYQQQLAEMLLQRAGSPVDDVDEEVLKRGLSQLFPSGNKVQTDWQKVAAATAVLQRFSVISGGPGTGKTTTVVRILALLLQQAGAKGLSIALAAPTGKAAARLQESILSAREGLPLENSLREMIPRQAVTLHRLLGSRPGSVYFKHNRQNPLPIDLLVIDEASMVDLALITKVVQALPAKARLILLGDRDQLASVEAGAVLADICGRQAAWTQPFRQRMEDLCDQRLPERAQSDSPMANAIALLHHSYRFDDESGIGRFSQSIKKGDGVAAVKLITDASVDDVSLIEGRDQLVDIAVSAYREYLQRIDNGDDITVIMNEFNRFRVLAALRHGPLGVVELNRLIERALHRLGLIRSPDDWYPGRPVLILRNDYNLHLYNGDIGICIHTEENRLSVCFTDSEGEVRQIAPSRISACETAFAMTVHKSQGSEFDRVLLALPADDSALLSRELLYTGVTRARRQVALVADIDLLPEVIGRRVRRPSGLKDALWGGR
ncbi:MAG: exodeoxyribonuclease V subunit alpha [Sedimenticola sp.]